MKTPLFRAGLKRDWETGKTVLGCRLTGLGNGEIRTGKRIYPLLVVVCTQAADDVPLPLRQLPDVIGDNVFSLESPKLPCHSVGD